VIEFTIDTMPRRVLSSNSISGSAAKRRLINFEKQRLRALSTQAVCAAFGTEIPTFDSPVIVYVTVVHSNKRPKVEDCWRCLDAALNDEPLEDPTRCNCYRMDDVFNVGGDVAKPIVDGLVDAGVIKDDSRKYVPLGVIGIEDCDTVGEEHYRIRIEEVTG